MFLARLFNHFTAASKFSLDSMICCTKLLDLSGKFFVLRSNDQHVVVNAFQLIRKISLRLALFKIQVFCELDIF